ncbi:LysR family transcriptional regulator [Rahnella selenatireducens]|uniref:LysR family transcriptional regulator n=1 Tax=Rahnella selenatireducens TaxID=3389797 RepID=UPI0039691285
MDPSDGTLTQESVMANLKISANIQTTENDDEKMVGLAMSIKGTERIESPKIRKFDLNLLIVLDAVYMTGSVKNAAALLNTSSPSISQYLLKLKDYFGDPLFLRDGQKLSPTTIATKLHGKIKSNLDGLISGVEDFEKDEYHQQLVIQCPIYLSIKIIPIIGEFFERENITCEIVHRVSDNMVDGFSDLLSLRQVDLIFGVSKTLGLSTKSFILDSEKLAFICKKNHPRMHDVFTEEDVKTESFCYIHTDELPAVITRQKVENSIQSGRIFSLNSPSFLSILSHVESSNSIAIVPQWLFKKFGSSFNIKLLETDIDLPTVDIAMSYNKVNLNKKMNHLLFEYLRDNFPRYMD